MRFVLVLALLWPATALAEVGVEIDVRIETPPSPPPPPQPPEPPPLPAVNHGWDTTNRVALSLTTSVAASLGTYERGQGVGGAVVFHAVGAFPLDMAIETVHERFANRSQTYLGYTLHVVDRRRRVQPYLVLPIGVAVAATPDVTTAQGFYGIGGGVRLRASYHWSPSVEMRVIHRTTDEMGLVPSETVATVRAGMIYLF